ncbi:Dienelactone hydrolase domain protein [[Actinomadura] parvosata subsp. kistnae]|uniref:Lysophospholipase n=1 Tax=[Actinomadura] parvosata subsp. kistnae TaxID=1909395 RepID=A0A1V0AJZ0_9ACTN|nr:alpha/beta fold hydrolase [Nonomuraea sp. ATCC 55076]AQZ70402.1 lysophospholipase [Nonomuraea sp. ATCC 55076]SPL88881.1 Dienelactone hydrolase domain protein [Actinomadura parvosata subsp. kistnae]
MSDLLKVSFDSDGVTLAGNLYLPDQAGPAPGVVVAGTWTSVKELMADRYARRLAERGYAALAFDFTGFGESGGEPRDVENPARKIRDIHHALTFLAAHPAVHGDRLGALGICAAAMYMAGNAAGDPRVRSLALVAPWLHDAAICEDAYGGAAAVAEKIKIGREARSRYDETGEVDYVPVVSATDPRAAMPYEIDFYLNPDRGGIPAWPNRFAVMAWPDWLTYDSIASAPQITQPTLLVHSENAAIPDGARRFHAGLAGPKDLLWTEGTQFDFYDTEPQVTVAVDAVAAHFGRTLR